MKRNIFAAHLMLLLIVTVLCGLIYVTVQQAHRANADDPQLQIASDIRDAIEDSRPVTAVMSSDSIDIARSLSAFKILLNKNGDPVWSTGFLEGQRPKLPQGVLDFTTKNQEDVLTWQPRRGVRIAMVVKSVNSADIAFVAVGRSLKEVEIRESNLRTMVLMGWIVCVALIALHFIFSYLNINRPK